MKVKILIFNLILIIVTSCLLSAPDFARADEFYGEQAVEMTNNVVLIRFEGADGFPSSSYLSKLDAMYNTSEISMKNYFLQSSLNSLSVTTSFLNGGDAVTVEKPKEYYLPRFAEYDVATNSYKEINPLGYDNRFFYNSSAVSPNYPGAVEHIERTVREQELLREVVSKIDAKLTNADSDGDGVIDSVTFILNIENTDDIEWNGILWPHMTMAYNLTEDLVNANNFVPQGFYEKNIKKLANDVHIDGLKVNKYNFLTTEYLERYSLSGDFEGLSNIGVLCHEFYHTLGLYDYYSYTIKDYESVGEVDILGITHPIPQMSLTYNRQKLGWLLEGENILPIEESGTYTLNAVTSDDEVKAYKLVLNDYARTGEYFMLEMRSNQGSGFDSLLSESGLIIYRVNEKNGFLNEGGNYSKIPYGNMYTPKDSEEIYVYREGAGEKVNTDAGDSLAILNGKSVIVGHTYKKDIFGTKDKTVEDLVYSYHPSGILGAFITYYNTTVFYGDKTNSGIAIENIKLSSDAKSVTFDITFDDQSTPVANSDDFSLSKTLDNKTEVSWTSGARKGNVTMLAVEYQDSLVYSSGDSILAKVLPSANEIKVGKMQGYNTVICQSTPISFKKSKLDIKDDAVIYALISDGENEFVKFVGVVKTANGDEFLEKFFDSVFFKVAILVLAVFVVSCVVFVVFNSLKKHKKSQN